VIKDHINLQGVNPLSGPNDERFGPRFPDMSIAYDRRFREMTVGEGNKLGIGMHEGVYAALVGPSYETPAEIRMLRTLGADIVGMTGAPEVFLARELEICYSAICFVSNKAAGMQQRLSAVEVMNVGKQVIHSIFELIQLTVERIPIQRDCMCSKATHQAQV
jgi:purine-nucleoside phosphorylase